MSTHDKRYRSVEISPPRQSSRLLGDWTTCIIWNKLKSVAMDLQKQFYKWPKITYQRCQVLGTKLAVTINSLNWWLAWGLRNLCSKAYMYILEKYILGTQILALGFFDSLQKVISIPGTIFLDFAFFTAVPKNNPKNGSKFKKCRKMTKSYFPLFRDPI